MTTIRTTQPPATPSLAPRSRSSAEVPVSTQRGTVSATGTEPLRDLFDKMLKDAYEGNTAPSPVSTSDTGDVDAAASPAESENRENFLQEARSANVSLADALALIDAYHAEAPVDPEQLSQLGGELNTLVGWASLEMDDASLWTGGLGHQTGVDLGVARRASTEAATLWNDAHGSWGEPEAFARLVADSEALLRKAASRLDAAIAGAN